MLFTALAVNVRVAGPEPAHVANRNYSVAYPATMESPEVVKNLRRLEQTLRQDERWKMATLTFTVNLSGKVSTMECAPFVGSSLDGVTDMPVD